MELIPLNLIDGFTNFFWLLIAPYFGKLSFLDDNQ